MPSYKLMYFNGRGRAEASRYLFALAGVEYEDYRFAEGEWPRVKPSQYFQYISTSIAFLFYKHMIHLTTTKADTH